MADPVIQGSELLAYLDVQELWTHQLKSIARALLEISMFPSKIPWNSYNFEYKSAFPKKKNHSSQEPVAPLLRGHSLIT